MVDGRIVHETQSADGCGRQLDGGSGVLPGFELRLRAQSQREYVEKVDAAGHHHGFQDLLIGEAVLAQRLNPDFLYELSAATF